MKPNLLKVSLKSSIIFSKPIEVGLCYIDNFFLSEYFLLILTFKEFLSECVIIFAFKDEIVILLIGAVTSHIKIEVSF